MVKIIKRINECVSKRDDEGKFVEGNHVKSEFKKGNKPWNYGLTKDTDERVKALSEDRNRNMKIGKSSVERNAVGNAKRGWDEWFENDPKKVINHLNKIRIDQARSISSIEIKVRTYLDKLKIRYITNGCDIEGTPDIIIPNNDTLNHIAIFVDGCYWHCCRKCFNWHDKKYDVFEKSIEVRHYDKTITEKLLNKGFIVYRIFEHDIESRVYEEIIKNIIKDNKLKENK